MRAATKEELKTKRGIIYLIHNLVNHKCYVGQSVTTFYGRYFTAKIPKYSSPHVTSQYLSNAIKKYGQEAFAIHIIESGKTLEELNYLEPFYAEIYNCYVSNNHSGYNLKGCGNNRKQHPETVEKVRQKLNKTYNYIDPNGNVIIVTNLKKFCKEIGLSYYSMQKINTGESIQYKGYSLVSTDREIVRQKLVNFQYQIHQLKNIKTGEIVEFYHIEQFCKDKGLSPGHVCQVLKRTKGYLRCKDWCHVSTSLDLFVKHGKILKGRAMKAILQFSKEGDYIKEWNSANEIAENLQCKTKILYEVCRGIKKSYKGFIWRYKDSYQFP